MTHILLLYVCFGFGVLHCERQVRLSFPDAAACMREGELLSKRVIGNNSVFVQWACIPEVTRGR